MVEMLEKLKKSLDISPEVEEKISSMFNKYRELDDDGKSEFLETVKGTLKDSVSKYKSGLWMTRLWMISQSYIIFLAAVVLILFIFVFFGYKLYNRLIERERKREEKKKLKQLKKKK